MSMFTAQIHSWQSFSNKTFSLTLINKVVSKKLNLMVLMMSVTLVRKINILVGVVMMIVIKRNQILMMLVTGMIGVMMLARLNMVFKNLGYFCCICE